MNSETDFYSVFMQANEPYAAGLFEYPHRDRFFRYACAQKKFWECSPMPIFQGGGLYPSGVKLTADYAVRPDYSFTLSVDQELLRKKTEEGYKAIAEEMALSPMIDSPHTVGGNIYTHSIPNYLRVVSEGLTSYERRVEALPEGDFRNGLLAVLEGIRIYHSRSLDILYSAGASQELIKALQKVPFEKADTLYEALVCWNFVYYLDFCDNPGRLDADLYPYYRGEDMTSLLAEFYDNVDVNSGWSSALGPDCNELTLQCLKAIRGKRRPSLELRVTENTPQEVWTAAADALLTGCGQPAFYNEKEYQSALHAAFPQIPREDLLRFNGGGCTETMLAGISHVGSLDAGINVALIFAWYIREELQESDTFERFYSGLLERIKEAVLDTFGRIRDCHEKRAAYRPQPVRTLLIDDCIQRVKDFNNGGARYNWSVVNLAGMVNVIDSLLVIRNLVYEQRVYSPAAFLEKLDGSDSELFARAEKSLCFGVDDDKADALAACFVNNVCQLFELDTPYLGGKYLPSSIQFATYTDAGREVPATPDGRCAGAPLCDSVGAIHGKDTKGITALLNSVAKLPYYLAVGTPVLNVRLDKKHLKQSLQPLVASFFSKRGMQLQVSCISREDMEDALVNPERHENLIVRIGGYSEYFNRLSPALKNTVIQRTEHSL